MTFITSDWGWTKFGFSPSINMQSYYRLSLCPTVNSNDILTFETTISMNKKSSSIPVVWSCGLRSLWFNVRSSPLLAIGYCNPTSSYMFGAPNALIDDEISM